MWVRTHGLSTDSEWVPHVTDSLSLTRDLTHSGYESRVVLPAFQIHYDYLAVDSSATNVARGKTLFDSLVRLDEKPRDLGSRSQVTWLQFDPQKILCSLVTSEAVP